MLVFIFFTVQQLRGSTYPPQSQSQLEAFRQMDLTIIQNMDFTTANAQILYDWLVEKTTTPSPGSRQASHSQLPLSPVAYWDSVVLGRLALNFLGAQSAKIIGLKPQTFHIATSCCTAGKMRDAIFLYRHLC
jgi:hypothetical protein